jgi:hypothetical protein
MTFRTRRMKARPSIIATPAVVASKPYSCGTPRLFERLAREAIMKIANPRATPTEVASNARIDQSLSGPLRTSGKATRAQTRGTTTAPHKRTAHQDSAGETALSRTMGDTHAEATAAKITSFII